MFRFKHISKKRFIQLFCLIVVVLGWVRVLFPHVAYSAQEKHYADSIAALKDTTAVACADSAASDTLKTADSFVPHRVYSVVSFDTAFPDENDVQLEMAKRNGVNPIAHQSDLDKSRLVYVGSNPYFYVDNLRHSIPYLVPKASALLQDIGKTFYDSLQVKGIPLQKIIVSSVMRSHDDVQTLQKTNGNAAPSSSHEYGTTFDICYNRYKVVADPDGPQHREVRNDTLKYVLSEVLNDMRKHDRCVIKHEKKQGCFHVTVK